MAQPYILGVVEWFSIPQTIGEIDDGQLTFPLKNHVRMLDAFIAHQCGVHPAPKNGDTQFIVNVFGQNPCLFCIGGGTNGNTHEVELLASDDFDQIVQLNVRGRIQVVRQPILIQPA